MKLIKQTFLLTCIMIFFSISSVFADFCWKDTYGRGVGTIPSQCTSNKDKIGELCYSKCTNNTKRFVLDCHSICPRGMRDDGLFCRSPEYGRGAGYPWSFFDGFSDAGMQQRCEKDHGRGKCEKYGLMYYPKCKPGFKPFGCCICRPSVPDCKKHGLNPGIDLSCAKTITIGSPSLPVCSDNKVNQAGLCYPKCKNGYNGVGPVCWGQPPTNWVDCGMGAAKDSAACGLAVTDQVSSVFILAANIVSSGAAKKISDITDSEKLKKIIDKVSTQWKAYKEKYKMVEKAEELTAFTALVIDIISNDIPNATDEDKARLLLEILGSAYDPSGVLSVAAAYTYPLCSKIDSTADATNAPTSSPNHYYPPVGPAGPMLSVKPERNIAINSGNIPGISPVKNTVITPSSTSPSIAESMIDTTVRLYGGSGGSTFDDSPVNFARIDMIQLCGGNVVDSVSTTYIDTSGQSSSQGMGLHGGKGGNCKRHKFSADEYISTIQGSYNNYVNSLSLTTNKGKRLSVGRKRGKEFSFMVEDNLYFYGFKGRSGAYIDSIGFKVLSKNTLNNEQICNSRNILIKASSQDLTMHAIGGSKSGANILLHGNINYSKKHANSQFQLIEHNGKYIIKVSDNNLTMHAYGGSRSDAYIRLHGGVDYAKAKNNSQFELIRFNGKYIIKVADQDLTMHAYGGSKPEAHIRLHGGVEYAKKHGNSQFELLCL